MPPDRDQYVQFTIKLLRGSFALNALWQDAVKYHMIDQPDKLIALRLTEYYEMVARGGSPSGLGMQQAMPVAQAPMPAPTNTGTLPPPQPVAAPATRGQASEPQYAASNPGEPINDIVNSSSPTVVEQNADEAADYWTAM